MRLRFGHRCLAIGILALGLGFQAPARAQDLPKLPAAIQSEGMLRAGVRCDQPPFGYRDSQGDFAGVEVAMARQMAAWAFGSESKAQLTCVTSSNRIPQLNAKRVDLLIATLGITPERARVTDFSNPYRWGTSDVLVKKNSPIHTLDELKGHTVIMLRGTTQSAWFDANMPDLKTLRLDTAADALQALLQGRGDAYAHDATTLVSIQAHHPELRLIGEPFAISEAAVGLRKGEPEWKAWIDAALAKMKAEKLYLTWLAKYVPADQLGFYKRAFTEPTPKGR